MEAGRGIPRSVSGVRRPVEEERRSRDVRRDELERFVQQQLAVVAHLGWQRYFKTYSIIIVQEKQNSPLSLYRSQTPHNTDQACSCPCGINPIGCKSRRNRPLHRYVVMLTCIQVICDVDLYTGRLWFWPVNRNIWAWTPLPLVSKVTIGCSEPLVETMPVRQKDLGQCTPSPLK